MLVDREVLLRPWAPDDARPLCLAVRESLESLSAWFPWAHAGYAIEETHAWIEHCMRQWASGQEYPFGVFARASGDVLGGVGINQIDTRHRSGNLGYWVRASRRGSGVAATASRLVACFAFETLRLVRLEIVVPAVNESSRRTAERIGATYECVARHRLLVRGAPTDAAVYSLVAGELASNNPFDPSPEG